MCFYSITILYTSTFQGVSNGDPDGSVGASSQVTPLKVQVSNPIGPFQGTFRPLAVDLDALRSEGPEWGNGAAGGNAREEKREPEVLKYHGNRLGRRG